MDTLKNTKPETIKGKWINQCQTSSGQLVLFLPFSCHTVIKIQLRTREGCTHCTFYKPPGAAVIMSQYLRPTQINRVNASSRRVSLGMLTAAQACPCLYGPQTRCRVKNGRSASNTASKSCCSFVKVLIPFQFTNSNVEIFEGIIGLAIGCLIACPIACPVHIHSILYAVSLTQLKKPQCDAERNLTCH